MNIKKSDVYTSTSTDRKRYAVIIKAKSLNHADEIQQQIFKNQNHVKTVEKRLHTIDSLASGIAKEALLNKRKLHNIHALTIYKYKTNSDKINDIKKILRKKKL